MRHLDTSAFGKVSKHIRAMLERITCIYIRIDSCLLVQKNLQTLFTHLEIDGKETQMDMVWAGMIVVFQSSLIKQNKKEPIF